MITTTVNSDLATPSSLVVAKMLSRIFQFHAFKMWDKVRYKLRWLFVLLSIAAAAGQPGNPRKVYSFVINSLHMC